MNKKYTEEELKWFEELTSRMGRGPKIGYMDLIDYEYELGAASYGSRVFPSEKGLREEKTCVESCGIVKIKIEIVEVVQEGMSFKEQREKGLSKTPTEIRHELRNIEIQKRELARYEALVERQKQRIKELENG